MLLLLLCYSFKKCNSTLYFAVLVLMQFLQLYFYIAVILYIQFLMGFIHDYIYMHKYICCILVAYYGDDNNNIISNVIELCCGPESEYNLHTKFA